MANKIIVGMTDGPVTARLVGWAVRRAVECAEPVEFLSIVGGAVGVVGEAPVRAEAVASTVASLDYWVDRARALGATVTARVEVGDPLAHFIEASREASMLVIGSDGQEDEARTRSGFHGLRIAAEADCPVVVIPDTDFSGSHGVVVGVDGSDVSQRALRFAAAEASRCKEALTAAMVWTPLSGRGNELLSYADQYFASMHQATEEVLDIALSGLSKDFPDLDVRKTVESGYPAQVINRLAAASRLCVVGSRGRGVIRRFFLGSISHEVLTRIATVTAVVR